MGGNADATEFDRDEGNAEKNWFRHRVTQQESEQVFFRRPLVVAEDDLHSRGELRHYALGQTEAGRPLFVVFTLRADRVRIISARDMTRRERKEYESAQAKELEANPDL
jgi:uncharacterized DUF497 family protein